MHSIPPILRHFIPRFQARVITDLLRGPEAAFYAGKLTELARIVTEMPQPYGTQALHEDQITVPLHYFTPSGDWWITERDISDQQHQAFGLASLNFEAPALGYISLHEMLAFPQVELDLHWEPKSLSATLKAAVAATA